MSKETKITRGYEIVTPEKAQKWLATSIGNRPIKRAKVALFAQDMVAGAWNRDAQPIYFDESGHLMDGHTRLNAVIKSGATIEVEVKRNFPRDEWNKLNTGSIWTAGDFGAANGIPHANSSMCAVKTRESLKRGFRVGIIAGQSTGKIGGRVWTNDELLRLFHADADWMDDHIFAYGLYREWHGIAPSMTAAVLHHLVHDKKWPREYVCDFFRQVYTMKDMTVNARLLHRRIEMERGSGRSLSSNYVCLLISRAFDGYVNNTPKNSLKVGDIRAIPTFPKCK